MTLKFFESLKSGDTFYYKELGDDNFHSSKFVQISESRSCPGVTVIIHNPVGQVVYRQKIHGFTYVSKVDPAATFDGNWPSEYSD